MPKGAARHVQGVNVYSHYQDAPQVKRLNRKKQL